MPTATLDQRIDLLDRLLQLDDLIEQAQAGLKVAGGTPPTGDPFTDFELGRIMDLAKELSTTVKDALAPLGTANQGMDAVQAFARLAEAAERAATSTGADKARQFGSFLSELNGAAGAIGWVVEGFSVTPVFGMYVFYLTKSLEALAFSIGYIEQYYDTVTGVWPDVLEPAWLAEFEDAARRAQQKARLREALEAELYDLKVERWTNEHAADRTDLHAATTVCLRELRATDPEVPATEDGLQRYLAAVDRLTQQVFGTTNRPAVMPMDAWREGDRFIVEFDLPGVDEESLDLDVERNVLTVHAERPDLDSDREMVSAERPRGIFSRQLFLGETLDTDAIEASYSGGVLRLTIPVAEKAKPRRIQISSEANQAINA